METMKPRVFLCEDATDGEISKAIFFTSNGFGDWSKQLQEMTCRVSGAEIPWDTVEHLGILGSGNSRCNNALKHAGMEPGMYTSRRGTWLLLIHPEEADIQKIVNRCGGRLRSLKAYNTQLQELDVSPCPLVEQLQIWNDEQMQRLSGLEGLQQLTELILPGCSSLQELYGLEGLQQLTALNLSGCSGLRELHGLEGLQQLTGLNLSGCSSLQELHGLERLQQLTRLNLSGCSSLTELHGLEPLQQLTGLYLSRCSGLTELHGLERLQQLTGLYLSKCSGLTELPEGIRGLKSLRKLDLSEMKLKTLPDWLPEIAEGFDLKIPWVNEGKEKANVCLFQTTVEDMEDLSIFEQPYEVVAEWFRNRSLGKTRTLNEIKVVFLGDGEAGKSHTIARLMNDGGKPKGYTDQSTPGIVIKNKDYDLDGRKFQVHYWDFGGQEIMHSMHRIFLTNRTMYVVLLNARDDTQGDRAHYWLQNIQSFAPNAPVLLVLNKIDQNPKASVDERTLRSKYPGLTQIVRLSALKDSKDQFNEKFKEVLLQEIVKTRYLDSQWPNSWIRVKERLEKMESHFILGDEYRRICRECQLDNVELAMLQYFNDLGVSFCFCGEEDYELEDHVILRPDWITNGLYIILFNQLEGAKNGLIPHKSIYRLLRSAHCNPDIRCTLPGARYDRPGDIEYVLGVMQKFDLSFTDGKKNEFIPMLCQQESTVDIAELEQNDQILEFNMEFEYLPENLLHRLMVERREELDMSHSWRRGAQFQVEKLGYSAVVFIDTDNTLRFFIRHTDPMHRPNTYLTVLKDNVDRIVRNMGLTPPTNQLVYKLEGKVGTFDYEELWQAREDHEVSVYSKTWRRRIQIEDIFNQSAPDDTEKEMLLLAHIRRACQHIQGEPSYYLTDDGKGLEDLRNRRVRDDLYGWGYNIQDQTQRGRSGTGSSIGELDLLLFNENREPWTAIEALRVSNGTKTEWKKHLKKLVGNYNYFGAPFLYLLTYVDAAPTDFARIWKGYQKTLTEYSPSEYRYCENSFTDLNDSNSPRYIKAAKCLYSCGGDPITVYHIFARIPLHGE